MNRLEALSGLGSIGSRLFLLMCLAIACNGSLAYCETYFAFKNFDEIHIYADGATGDDLPLRTISGPSTNLDQPWTVALAPDQNELWVTNSNPPGASIAVFSMDADGDVPPIRSIEGPLTLLTDPLGLAVDTTNDEIIVANNSSYAVLVFSRTAVGDVAPVRVISGSNTGLFYPRFVLVDLVHDEIFVSQFSNKILVFDRLDQGNVSPKRVIQGPNTAITAPRGLYLDLRRNQLIVCDEVGSAILVFDRTADGDASPLRVITGPATGLDEPRGLVVDRSGEIIVAPPIAAFSIDADGDSAPLWSINSDFRGSGITRTTADSGGWGFVIDGLLFADGLESGNTSTWSETAP